MKKIIIAILLLFFVNQIIAQVVGEDTRQKVGVSVTVFNDFWMEGPEGIDSRFVNLGSNIAFAYNHRLGKSPLFLSIGAGLAMHNYYSDGQIDDIKADTITFSKISQDYKKSKMSMVYLDIPFEFRFKTKGGFRMAVGFKAGYLIDSKIKYKGDRGPNDQTLIKVKSKGVNQLEPWKYGPTFRVGYKWINLWGYYQLSGMFTKDRGPDLYPVSVGIMILPW